MSTLQKRLGKWQVQIRKKGYPSISKSFHSKATALTWSKKVESEMERGVYQDALEAQATTVAEALDRYATQVLPKKKGASKEEARLEALKKHFGTLTLSALRASSVTAYRDSRLEEGKAPATVRRELAILSHALNVVRKEWSVFLPQGNPVEQIRLPKLPNGRDRRLETGEEEKLLKALKDTPTVRTIVELALETAMRRGEIAAVRWEHVNLKARTLLIPDTKTGTPRTVPLSTKAIALLTNLPRNISGVVFDVAPDSITQAFDRACTRAKLEGLRFHDLRHEATSRLFEKGLNPMEVATITGHKDLRMLRRYTHLRAEDLARKLG